MRMKRMIRVEEDPVEKRKREKFAEKLIDLRWRKKMPYSREPDPVPVEPVNTRSNGERIAVKIVDKEPAGYVNLVQPPWLSYVVVKESAKAYLFEFTIKLRNVDVRQSWLPKTQLLLYKGNYFVKEWVFMDRFKDVSSS